MNHVSIWWNMFNANFVERRLIVKIINAVHNVLRVNLWFF